MRAGLGLPLPPLFRRVWYGRLQMRRRLLLLGSTLVATVLLAAACSGGDDGVAPGAPEGVPDEEYLAILCEGTEAFSSALIGQQTPEQLRAVITDYVADLKAVVPPRDISQWHLDYIAFLEQAESVPGLMVSGNPPMPPEPARGRLAGKERTVEACKSPIFFAPRATTTPAR